jgi:Mn2+/Fe2+ NRAMP family transporter
MFWANVLQGVLSPVLVVLLVVIGNSRRIMDKNNLGLVTNAGLVLAAIVMFGASVLLFYGGSDRARWRIIDGFQNLFPPA